MITMNSSTMQSVTRPRHTPNRVKPKGGGYVFKGKTAALGGNVFQVHSEQRRHGQFSETMDALKVYASTKYVNHIEYLTPIFVNLLPPSITKPTLTNSKITVTLADGTTREIDNATKEELLEFEYKMKFYVKEEISLKVMLRSLFNIIMGQCSKMMISRMAGDEKMKQVKKDSDIIKLLKIIRGVSREITTNTSYTTPTTKQKENTICTTNNRMTTMRNIRETTRVM